MYLLSKDILNNLGFQSKGIYSYMCYTYNWFVIKSGKICGYIGYIAATTLAFSLFLEKLSGGISFAELSQTYFVTTFPFYFCQCHKKRCQVENLLLSFPRSYFSSIINHSCTWILLKRFYSEFHEITSITNEMM